MPNFMNRNRKAFYALLLLALTFVTLFFVSNQEPSYEAFLAEHPYNQRLEIKLEDIPKRDRPDLAWRQDFLATMDPALKRPMPERLDQTRKQVASYFKEKSSLRTGTAEFPWVERGPNNVGGRTRAIMWDPNDATGKKVWAGSVSGGLWYTNDIYSTAAKWNKVDDFWSNISITSIAYDPNNKNILYVGTGEGFGVGASRGAGVWKSTDGGATWNQLSASTEFYYVNDLIVRNESGSSVLYVATRGNYHEGEWHALDNQGLQRSTNGGTSFTQVMPMVPSNNVTYAISDLELGGDNRIWAGSTTNAYSSTNRGGGSILYSDNGTNWTLSTQRTNAVRVELATSPSDGNVVYALIEGGNVVSEVIKTTDRGSTWTNLPEPNDADTGIPEGDFTRGQAWYDLIMVVDPNNPNVVLAGGIDLFKSSDGGSTWKQISKWSNNNNLAALNISLVHADQHAIAFKPGSSTDVIFGNDGGMYVSSTMTQTSPTFINRNNGYNVTQFYSAAIHPTSGKNYFLAGAQDNGTHQFQTTAQNATAEVTGGDGAFCFIDQKSGNIQISSYVNNSYYLSRDGGTNFSEISNDQTTGSFINPADYDDNLGILYAGNSSSSIARFTNIKSGTPSRNDFNISLGSDATHFRVSPFTTASSTLFIGTGAGKVFKVTNANTTPQSTDISGASFPDGSVSCIEIGATENELLVTFSNYGVTSVWQTSNGGSSWISKEGNLPDMPIRWALYNPNDRNEVILATELGIWRTENISVTTPSWVSSNIGLANVRVDMLQIRDSDKEVIAATFGRGLYSSSGFSSSNPNELKASFSSNIKSISIGGSVSFTDNSSGSPTSWNWTFAGGTPATSIAQNPTVTYGAPGQFAVTLVVTDGQGGSNTSAVSNYITVLEAPKPNLAFYQPEDWANPITISIVNDDFTNTDNLTSGTDLKLAYAIQNNGDAAASTPMKVEIKVDGTKLLDESWNISSSDPLTNGFYNFSSNVNIGKLAAGEHAITVTIDINSEIAETIESDNVQSYTFFTQESCGTNTTLTSASGTITDGSGNQNYYNYRDCQWTISPANAASVTISFTAFDLEDDFDFLDVYAGSNTSTPVASLTGTALPAAITVEEGQVILVFTTDEEVTAGGFSLSYESTLTQPDLAIDQLSFQIDGSSISIASTVVNSGNGESSQSEIAFYLSTDDALSSSDELLTTTSISALTPNQDKALTVTASLTSFDPGNYHLIAIVDEEKAIAESDESNNTSSIALEIIAPKVVLGNTANTLRVYPNPVINDLNIEGVQSGKYTLTNLSGQTLKAGEVTSDFNIDMSSYPKGIYLLNVVKEGKLEVIKVQKR
jgi:PKD repeat protein